MKSIYEDEEIKEKIKNENILFLNKIRQERLEKQSIIKECAKIRLDGLLLDLKHKRTKDEQKEGDLWFARCIRCNWRVGFNVIDKETKKSVKPINHIAGYHDDCPRKGKRSPMIYEVYWDYDYGKGIWF